MNLKRGILLKCSECGHINETIVELKIRERYLYGIPHPKKEALAKAMKESKDMGGFV